MMKKIIIFSLSLALIFATFVGCGNSNSNNSDNSNKTLIGEEQAKTTALSDANVDEADLVGIFIKLETDDGSEVYEVEFRAGSNEYDYTIDAYSGDILESDNEVENMLSTNSSSSNNDNGTTVTIEEATNLALARVKGATASDIRIHLDNDDGRRIYEGSIVYNGVEYDFEIDADTGDFIEWSSESVYDD